MASSRLCRQRGAVCVLVLAACIAMASAQTTLESFREIGSEPITEGSVRVYDQSSYGSPSQEGRGSLTCRVGGEELPLQSASLSFSVDGELIAGKSAKRHTKLSELMSDTVELTGYQHATFTCLRLSFQGGVHIPVEGSLHVSATLGSQDVLSDTDVMGYGDHEEFSVRGAYNLLALTGPHTIVLSKTVQPEDAEHLLGGPLDDFVSDPAAKLAVSSADGNVGDRLLPNNTVVRALEFLVPTRKFDVWAPPQVKETTYNSITLYLPKQITNIPLSSWNVSWAVTGSPEFTPPTHAVPGEQVVVDGLHPDTVYQFRACAMHASNPAVDECSQFVQRTKSFVGRKQYPTYRSVGLPRTHPKREGDGAFITIPQHRTPDAPPMKQLFATFYGFESGELLKTATFSEAGNHVIGGFDSGSGYKAHLVLTDDAGNSFAFEEGVKYGPRGSSGIAPREIGAPRAFRTAVTTLAVDVPRKESGFAQAELERATVRVYSSISRDLLREELVVKSGVVYLRELPDGPWTVRVNVTDTAHKSSSSLFVFNPLYEGSGTSLLAGGVRVEVNDEGKVEAFIPLRLDTDGPKVVSAHVVVVDPVSSHRIAEKRVGGRDVAVFDDLPQNMSLRVETEVKMEDNAVVHYDSLIRRLDGATVPPMTALMGPPRLEAITPTSFAVTIPPRVAKGDFADIQEATVYVYDALLGKPIRNVTAPGAGTLQVAGLSRDVIYNVRVTLLRGIASIPRSHWKKDSFHFAPRTSGLPPFTTHDPIRAFIASSASATQLVTVRLPPSPPQLQGYGTYGRVDALIFASPVLSPENSTLLMHYVGLDVGDTVFEGLPPASDVKLDVRLKVWTDGVLKTRPQQRKELEQTRKERLAADNAHTSSTTAKPITFVQQLPNTDFQPEFDMVDGSFPLSFNDSVSGVGKFRGDDIGVQFASGQVQTRLPGQPEMGGSFVVPTVGGVVVRTTAYFCAECPRMDSAMYRATTSVKGQEGRCKGKAVSVGQWEVDPSQEIYIPTPTGVDVDVCMTAFDSGGRRTMAWHLPASRIETVPPMTTQGRPHTVPFDHTAVLVRVPLKFHAEQRVLEQLEPLSESAGMDDMAKREAILRMMEQQRVLTFEVSSATLRVNGQPAVGLVVGDNHVQLPPNSNGKRVVLDAELHGEGKSAVVRLEVFTSTVAVPASLPPLPSAGYPSMLCDASTNDLLLRLPARLTPDDEAIVSASVVVREAVDGSEALFEGDVTPGDTQLTLAGVEGKGVTAEFVIETTAARNITAQTFTACIGGLPPLAPSGSPFLQSTVRGGMFVRVPPTLAPSRPPIEQCSAVITTCQDNTTVLWRGQQDSGGDLSVPPSLFRGGGCFLARVNVSDSDSVVPETFQTSAVVSKTGFLPPLPEQGPYEFVPVGDGVIIARVPLFGVHENPLVVSRARTIRVQLFDGAMEELMEIEVPRGQDTILRTPCWDNACIARVTQEVATEQGRDKETRKFPIAPTQLTFVPHPHEPDLWTPTPSTMAVFNPVPQLVHVKVATAASGRVVAEQDLTERKHYTIDDLDAGTNYVVTLDLELDGVAVERTWRLKTPLPEDGTSSAGGDDDADNDGAVKTPLLPYPLSVAAGATDVLVQAPELTLERPTRLISVEVRDVKANTTASRASLSHPLRGESVLATGLSPHTHYIAKVTTTNDIGQEEVVVRAFNTTRSSNLWGKVHSIVNKKESSFDIRPAYPPPEGIVGSQVAVEDVLTLKPKQLYIGSFNNRSITVDMLTLGHRYRVGWSLRTLNATYYDMCAWVTMDMPSPKDGEARRPRLLRVTSEQVYLALPSLPALDHYSVALVAYDEDEREERRMVMYEGKGEEFLTYRGTTENAYIARMLAPNTEYSFAVQAHFNDHTTSEPVIVNATTDSIFTPCVVGRPLPPQAPIVVPGSNVKRKFQVVWSFTTANEGPHPDAYPTSAYSLEILDMGFNATRPDPEWEFLTRNISYMKNNFVVRANIPGYVYKLRLTAFNFWGQSDAGEVVTVRIPDERPEPVPSIAFENATADSVVVRWTEPYHNGQFITNYKIECAPPPARSAEVYPSDIRPRDSEYGMVYYGSARFLAARLQGFPPASNVSCRVFAQNILGYSNPDAASTDAFWTRTSVPEAVAHTAVQAIGRYYAEFVFEKPRHNGLPIVGYDVMMMRPGRSFELECDDLLGLTCKVGTLLPGDDYAFKVRAFNCRGASAWSPVQRMTTLSAPPDPPTNLVLTAATHTSLALDWDTGRNNGEMITAHSLQCDGGATCLTPRGWTRAAPPPCKHSGNATAATDGQLSDDALFREVYRDVLSEVVLRDLLPATTYRCRAFAHNSEGASNTTHWVAFRTDDTVPDSPPSLRVTLGDLDPVSNTFPALAAWDYPAPNGQEVLEFRLQQKNVSRMLSSSGYPVTDPHAPSSPNGYQWRLRTPAAHTGLSFDIGPLLPDRNYKLRLLAENSLGVSAWSTLDFKSPPGRPEAPAPMVLNAKTGQSLTLTCPLVDDAGALAHTYVVEIAAGAQSMHGESGEFGPFVEAYRGEQSRVLVEGLEEGTDYLARCAIVNDHGTSTLSSPAQYTTMSGPPDQPPAVQIETTEGKMIGLSCALADDNGQRITRCDVESSGAWVWNVDAFDANMNPYETRMESITGFEHPYNARYGYEAKALLAGHKYGFRVRCWNQFGSSSWSEIVYHHTLGIPPEPPLAPSASGPVGTHGLTLDLGNAFDNGDALTRTKVEWQCVQGQCEEAMCGSIDALGNCVDPKVLEGCNTPCDGDNDCDACDVSGLLPGTTYRFWNYAENSLGWSLNGDVLEVTTMPDVPSVPLGVSAAFNSPHDATVKWDLPETDNGAALTAWAVKVLCADASNPDCVVTQHDADISGSREFTVQGLLPSQVYTVSVLAFNDVGHSPPGTVGGLRSPAAAPDAPSRPRVMLQSASSITISWEAPNLHGATAVAYTVQASPQFEYKFADNEVTGVSGTFYEFTNLDTTKLYQFRVAAVSSGGFCTEPNSECGQGDWSLLSFPARTQASCPVHADTSPDACSRRGTCDTRTYRCYCAGNYIGDSCQHALTRGICQVTGSQWSTFDGLPPFAHTGIGEYEMYSNSLLFGERVHVWKNMFLPGSGVAPTKFGVQFEGQKLTVQLDPSNPNACPYLRHNCRDVPITGSYVAYEKRDASDNVVGQLKFSGSCYSSLFSIENTITRTKVWCTRFGKESGDDAPSYFESCYVSVSRRLCTNGDTSCDAFATETGLCGKQGRSLADPNVSPLSIEAKTGLQSLFINADGEACTDPPSGAQALTQLEAPTLIPPPTASSSVVSLPATSTSSDVDESVQAVLAVDLQLDEGLPVVRRPTVTKQLRAQAHAPVGVPPASRVMVPREAIVAQQQARPRPASLSTIKVTGLHSTSPYHNATPVMGDAMADTALRATAAMRPHFDAAMRPRTAQRSRVGRDVDERIGGQAEVQTATGAQAMAGVSVMGRMSQLQDAAQPQPEEQAAEEIVDAVGEQLSLPPAECSSECEPDVCSYAMQACAGIGPCKASCLNNICLAGCRDTCSFDWVSLARKCDSQFESAVRDAQDELSVEINEANNFVLMLKSGHKASLAECPEFVSGSEVWNVPPYDRGVPAWTDALFASVLNSTARAL